MKIIEEKAKAYDKALAAAKHYYENLDSDTTKNVLEEIFPELQESEDEKIRKEIIEYIKTGTYHKSWLAWLEKQGEQKSIDNQFTPEQASVLNKHIDISIKQKPVFYIPKFHIGDKLVSIKNPSLTYEVLEVGHISELGNPEYKVQIFTDGKLQYPYNTHYIECYKVDEWAKLIEPKSAELSEDRWHSMVEKPKYPCDIIYVADNENMFIYRYLENGRPNDVSTPSFSNLIGGKWCYCKDIISQKLQSNIEWSDEDYNQIETIACHLDNIGNGSMAESLLNIRDKYELYRPQNWTKEDKERYISCLQRLSTGNPEQPETINSKWFKEHVYPQKQWKPSEEQMKSLHWVLEFCNTSHQTNVLKELYKQLKQL